MLTLDFGSDSDSFLFRLIQRASSLAQEGCSLHAILPRALQHLAKVDTSSDACDDLANDLERVGLKPEEFLKPSDADGAMPMNDARAWTDMLQELVDSKELSHAEINRKRKRLTFQAFAKPEMGPMCVAAEILVEPNAHRMNVLFGRSSAISALQRLPRCEAAERQKLETSLLS